jgi:hypothetical protein
VEHLLWAQVYLEVLSLIMGVLTSLFNFNFSFMAPPSCRLGQNFALGHIKEFACAIRAHAPLASILASLKIVNFVVNFALADMGPPIEIPSWIFNQI